MCHLVLLLLVCSAIMVNANANLQQWETFKTTYNKTYADKAEEAARYKIFLSRLKSINEHNVKYERGEVIWYQAVNPMSDLDLPNVEPKINVDISKNKNLRIHVTSDKKIPDSVDWRDKGAITEVQDQGTCGACWSFAIAGNIEGMHAIKTGKLVKLSEQSLIDCATETGYYCFGCKGGNHLLGLQYVQDHGINYYKDYPFEEAKHTCRRNSSSVLHISGITFIANNFETNILDAVANVGPVIVSINQTPIQNYAGGIFKDEKCSNDTEPNHLLLVVGYGTENGTDYWLLKNSLGTSWGLGGYMKMARGENMCGIAGYASYVNL